MTHTKPGLTKAHFIAQADAICRAEGVQLRYVEHRAGELEGAPIASLTNNPRLIRKALAIREAASAKLESLPEPPGATTAIRKWLTTRIVATTLAGDTAEAPAGRDASAVEAVQRELTKAIAIARGLAQVYGFKVCGTTE